MPTGTTAATADAADGGGELDADGPGVSYHNLTVTGFLDPLTKQRVVQVSVAVSTCSSSFHRFHGSLLDRWRRSVQVVQEDVTARVTLERRLAEVMCAEHEML